MGIVRELVSPKSLALAGSRTGNWGLHAPKREYLSI